MGSKTNREEEKGKTNHVKDALVILKVKFLFFCSGSLLQEVIYTILSEMAPVGEANTATVLIESI